MNFDPTGWEQDPNNYDCEDMAHTTAYENIPHVGENSIGPVQVPTKPVPSQVCFYGQNCKYGGCSRSHLDDAHTPCLYGPRCTKAGCPKIHPDRFEEECYYDEKCKLPWCRYIHTKDKCSRGKK